jgi:hypothetical protein
MGIKAGKRLRIGAIKRVTFDIFRDFSEKFHLFEIEENWRENRHSISCKIWGRLFLFIAAKNQRGVF